MSSDADQVEVVREDVPYLRVGGEEFLARVWRPANPSSSSAVAVVDVHGGAWCDNDRRFGKRYDKQLAAEGAVVVAIDFRCGASGPHPAGSTDVASAVRWVRSNAAELGVDADRIVSVGSSSGGHLAWLAALQPAGLPTVDCGEIRIGTRWGPADEGDPSVRGVGAFWPPVDPLARYRYAAGLETDHGRRLVANTEAYFGDENAMAGASIAGIVDRGQATEMPPVLLVVPEHDRNVPPEITDAVAVSYRTAGGEIQVESYPGVGHGFGHKDGDETVRFDAHLAEWIRRVAAP